MAKDVLTPFAFPDTAVRDETRNNLNAEPIGTAASFVAQHESADNPHPQYANLNTSNIFHGQQVFGKHDSTIGSFAVRNLLVDNPPATIGYFIFQTYNYDLVQTNMAGMYGITVDRTVGAESAQLVFYTTYGGVFSQRLVIRDGVYVAGTTGGNRGAGTFNAKELYENGVRVVERGSNANGEYTQFADGTLICWQPNFPTVSGGPARWTYPVSFLWVPSVSATLRFNNLPRVVACDIPATSYVDISSWDLGGSANVYPEVSVLAIGRWK